MTTIHHLIEPEEFKHQLMTFGDKMTQEEIDDIFGEIDFDDDGFILTGSVVRTLVNAYIVLWIACVRCSGLCILF